MVPPPASEASWPERRNNGDAIENEFRGQSSSKRGRWLMRAVPCLLVIMLALFAQGGQSRSDQSFIPRSEQASSHLQVEAMSVPADGNISQQSPAPSLTYNTGTAVDNVYQTSTAMQQNASVPIAMLLNQNPLWLIRDNRSLEVQPLFSQDPDITTEIIKECIQEYAPFKPVAVWQRLPTASWLAGKLKRSGPGNDCRSTFEETSQEHNCSRSGAKMTWYEMLYALLFGSLGLARYLLKPEQGRPQQARQQAQQ